MNDNILCMGYEAQLQPNPVVRKRPETRTVMTADEIYKKQIEFFGLDKLFRPKHR